MGCSTVTVSSHSSNGFTLVEMAIVLLIIGILTKSALGPLASLQEHRKRSQTTHQLEVVREAVFAHIVAYGALPCPLPQNATDTAYSFSAASSSSGGRAALCNDANGFVPAHSLRLDGATNEQGALLDPWGSEYRFAVSLQDHDTLGNSGQPDWTTQGEAGAVGVGGLSADIVLCNNVRGADCAGRSIRSDQIAFVVLSPGRDASASGQQSENLDADNYFVYTEESVVADSPFDDLLVWGSAADVMYWMLRIGWLP